MRNHSKNADNTAKRQILNGTYRTDSHNVTTVFITRSLLYCKQKQNTASKILYHIENSIFDVLNDKKPLINSGDLKVKHSLSTKRFFYASAL